MKRFKIEQSTADIVSQSGLALIGQAIRDIGGRAASRTKAELILLRRLVADQSLLLLPRAQRSLLAWLTPSRLGLDTPNPFSLIRLPPIRYRIAVHFQLRRYRNITHALLSPSNSLLSQMFLCLWRQGSSVRFHPDSLTKIQLIRNIFNCRVNNMVLQP